MTEIEFLSHDEFRRKRRAVFGTIGRREKDALVAGVARHRPLKMIEAYDTATCTATEYHKKCPQTGTKRMGTPLRVLLRIIPSHVALRGA